MKIIDCQVHVEAGLSNYDLKVDGRNIIFNTTDDYKNHNSVAGPHDSIALVFDFKNNIQFVNEQIRLRKIRALKVHSRIQRLNRQDYAPLAQALKAIPSEIPVIVDAFYWGAELEFQPSLEGIIHLIQSDPKRIWVVAHGGGYEVMKYYVHLRKLTNVYYDLSLSLQYFEDSSLFADFRKLIKWTDKARMMFGSDYPDSSPKRQYELLTDILTDLNVSRTDQELVCGGNAQRLYGIKL